MNVRVGKLNPLKDIVKRDLESCSGHKVSEWSWSDAGGYSAKCESCGEVFRLVRTGAQFTFKGSLKSCSGLEINLGDIVPMSTVDYPGQATSAIFLRGCPLVCRHCHNDELRTGYTPVSVRTLREKVKTFAPFVSSITISGGEPLLQPAAVRVLSEIARSYGLDVCLHTSGIFPAVLKRLIKYLDYVILDIKECHVDQGIGAYLVLADSDLKATIRITTFPETGSEFVDSVRAYFEDTLSDRIEFKEISGTVRRSSPKPLSWWSI